MGYKSQQSGIYCIIINGIVVYIGQTRKHRTRWAAHKNALENNRHTNQYLQNKYNKNKNLSFEMLEILEDDNLSIQEKKWVNYYGYDNLCNLQYPDAEQTYIVSKETIAKITKAHTGRKNTPETIQRMRLAQTGKKNHMHGKQQTVLSNQARSRSLRKYYENNEHHSKGTNLSSAAKVKKSLSMKLKLKDPKVRLSYTNRLPKMNDRTANKIALTLYQPINEDLFDELIIMGVRKKDIEQIFNFTDTKYYSELKRHKERTNVIGANKTQI